MIGIPEVASFAPSIDEGSFVMSGLGDKVKGKVSEAKGGAKEAYGRETGNEEIAAEGKMDQAKGKGQGAMGEVKEAAHDVKDKLSR